MRSSHRRTGRDSRPAMAMLALALGAATALAADAVTPRRPAKVATTRGADIVDRLGFERNVGQAPGFVAFVARTRGYTAFMDERGALLGLHGSNARVRVSAGDATAPLGADRRPHVVHHIRSSLDGGVVRGVPAYGRLVQPGVLTGVEASWRLRGGLLELVMQVAPGAVDEGLAIDLGGVTNVTLVDGAVEARAGNGRIRLTRPVAWQDGVLDREPVRVEYVLGDAGRICLRVGEHDATRAVWIDPQIEYLTYFGSDFADGESACLGADSSGRSVLGMLTHVEDLPVTDGAFQEDPGSDPLSSSDVFIAKFEAEGDDIVWATYFGGAGGDAPSAVVVGDDDTVYVGGSTRSEDLPLENAAISEFGGGSAGFYCRLSADGASLVSSTYTSGTHVRALAVGSAGHVGVTIGDIDPYFERYSADGGTLDWTFELDLASATVPRTRQCDVAVDPLGGLVIGGWAYGRPGGSASYLKPTSGVIQETYGGGSLDGFLAKVDASGEQQWLTYLGGSNSDQVKYVEIDAIGMIVVSGLTASTDFPRADGATEPAVSTLGDIFVARVSPRGDSLRMTTLITSPAGFDRLAGAEVHPAGRIYLAGLTDSVEFPLTAPTSSQAYGADEVWLMEMSSLGDVGFATFACVGSADEKSCRLAVDPAGAAHVLAVTRSTDTPTTDGAYQAERRGYDDVVMEKVSGIIPSGLTAASLDLDSIEMTRGRPGTFVLNASGGRGPFGWWADGLVAGMTLARDGTLSGAPTAVGTHVATIDVAGEYGLARGELEILVNAPPMIVGAGLAPWTRGVPIDTGIMVVGGTLPITVTHVSGDLPPGTQFTEEGRLVGTPSFQGAYSFEVRVVDHWDAELTAEVTLQVNPPVQMPTSTLPDATDGQPYTVGLEGADGSRPYVWSVVTGQAHTDGGIVADSGAFAGAVRAPGTYSFTARVEDSAGSVATRDFTVRVNTRPHLGASTLPLAAVDRPYAKDLDVDGGTPGFTWNVVEGSLPGGIRLTSAGGKLHGTPVTGGTRSLVLRCADRWQASTEARLELMVAECADVTAKGKYRETLSDFQGAAEPLPVVRHLELLGGSALNVSVKRLSKTKEAPPFELTLLDGSGAVLNTAPFASESKTGRRIKKFPISATGRYFVRLVADRPAIGELRLDVKVKPPKRAGATRAIEDGQDVELIVPAFEGRKLSVSVRPAKKSAARPVILSVRDAAGNDLLAAGKRKTSKSKDSLKVVVPVGGDVQVVVGSAEGGGDGAFIWSATSVAGKGYPLVLSDLPSGD